MRAMDLSKFKKIDSDDNCTMLQHKDGHELRIAHSKLSAKMRADLEKLPTHKKMAHGGQVQKFAEGTPEETVGDTSTDTEVKAPQTPVVINVNGNGGAPKQPDNSEFSVSPVEGEGAAPLAPSPVMAAPKAVPAAAPPPAPPRAPAATLAPLAAPPTPPSDVDPAEPGASSDVNPPLGADATNSQEYQKSYQDYKQEHVQDLAEKDAAWAHDLTNGHITPKTYGDIFGKKDTLGKIGMIFGLLTSSIGAGLTHQPNALIQAMNETIKNDLEAQRESKTNARGFLQLNQQQMLQDAQIRNMEKQGKVSEAQAKSINAEASTKAFTLSQMQMNRAALHNQALAVEKMPEGAQKESAKQALAMMGTAVNAENANLADVGASRAALLSSGQNGMPNTSAMRLVPGMEPFAKSLEDKMIPGVGMSNLPVPQNKRDELEAMNTLDYKAKDLLNYIGENKGTLSPDKMQVGAQKAEEMVNYYNSSIKGGVLTEGRLKWLDSQINKKPTSIIQDLLGNTARLKEIQSSNAERKKIMLTNLGVPQKEVAAQGGGGGPQYKISGGVKYMRGPNGEAIRVK